MDDEFMLDEEDDLEGQNLISTDDEDEDDEDDEDSEDIAIEERQKPKTEADYGGKLTENEIKLSSAYNDIVYAASKEVGKISVGGGRAFDALLVDAVRTIVSSNPKHTAAMTVESITKDMFQAQGHSRIVSSLYTPDQPLRGSDLDDELGGTDDSGFNQQFAEEARNQIARFIKYLAERDLSKDSIISRRRKQRQIPAFIIFLFSSGMYDLIIDCPTMPEEYAKQVKKALERLEKAKQAVVEALAERYEQHNRPKVAERVRKIGTSWFNREPAEIRTTSEYADLNLTQQDVIDYREFRSKFTNVSKSLTQDVISDMIEVVLDKEAGIYERLKDKTRSDAIADVKQVYKDWSKNNQIDTELADRIIWKQ